jgi:hypothetical protein
VCHGDDGAVVLAFAEAATANLHLRESARHSCHHHDQHHLERSFLLESSCSTMASTVQSSKFSRRPLLVPCRAPVGSCGGHSRIGMPWLTIPQLSIVFIHGLTGDREKTWKTKSAAAPRPQILLPARVPNARILTFGYDAYVTDWRGMVSKNRIGTIQ